jgi:predicted O-methyltransferase YrrM
MRQTITLQIYNMLETLQGLFEEKKNRIGSDIAGHLPYLLELVEAIKPKIIVHAGIRDGHSGAAFALGAFKVGSALVDIDMSDYQNLSDSKYNFQEIREQLPFWTFKKGTTEAVFPDLDGLTGKVDIFFTDTSHNYADTKFEFDNYATLLSPTGVILTHDTDPWLGLWPDQTRAIEEWLLSNPEWKHKTQKGNNGMTVFYRDETHLCGVVCDNELSIGTHTK